MEGCDMNTLPEACVSTIISLTSPPDACRLSLLSSSFRSAAESDVVWDRFLPSDYPHIVSTSLSALKFSSKKELFLCLSHPLLIDGGNKSFKLEKSSGRKSYIISARQLSITGSNDPLQWIWKSIPESRFSDVAELRTVSRLEIQGNIKTKMLSPNTRYGAYLIMKISEGAYGLNSMPSEVSVSMGAKVVISNTAYLGRNDIKTEQMESLFYWNRMQMLRKRVNVDKGEGGVPREREDGWMEIELGEFFSGEGDDEEVKMSLKEVKGYQLKGGLIIEGIEVRPRN